MAQGLNYHPDAKSWRLENNDGSPLSPWMTWDQGVKKTEQLAKGVLWDSSFFLVEKDL